MCPLSGGRARGTFPPCHARPTPSGSGVNRNSLRSWRDAFGTRTKTNANGEKVASLIAASDSATAASGLSDAERIRVLERENAKLREEREILRKAAKYFAEETNW